MNSKILLIAIGLVLVLVIGFSGCVGTSDTGSKNNTSTLEGGEDLADTLGGSSSGNNGAQPPAPPS